MSILIDWLVSKNNPGNNTSACINNKWYIAKPIGYLSLKERLKDAFRILTNKSFAVHFKEDEIKKNETKKNNTHT